MSHQKFREKHQLNFPLLVDTDGKLTELFGAPMAGKPLSRRVSFLVGLDGRVAAVTDNGDAQIHLDEMPCSRTFLQRSMNAWCDKSCFASFVRQAQMQKPDRATADSMWSTVGSRAKPAL